MSEMDWTRLRALREAHGLTQSELALDSGCKQSWLSLVESGQIAEPGATMLVKLAGGLGINVDHLVRALEYRKAVAK